MEILEGFGISDWIRDITRRSRMVRRIRFIYWGSFSKLGNVPECLYGDSRRFRNLGLDPGHHEEIQNGPENKIHILGIIF